VYQKETPIFASSDSVICTGNVITFVAGGLGEDKTDLRWSFTDGDTVTNVNPVKHAFDAVGTYTVGVTAFHKLCANSTLTQVVHVFPYPVINLGPDTAICIGSKSITIGDKINADNLRARWTWNTGETSSSIVITKPGVYYTSLVINGCPVSDTVTVLNDCYMDVPNAFSPNGDGLNDYFLPRQFLTKGLTSFKMDIFNRWGQLVFSTKLINGLGWDGKFNDIPQPEGVYIFKIDANFKDGQIESHTGNLTLLR
ncbi:MAG: domain containing protein, partial [Flavipsychrobacter sp.]|nr:domain containing protein [Flavipsychrobacter sp.]